MLLASTVDSSFDENYNNRLFFQFEQHPILSWSPKAHRDYLTKRGAVEGLTPDANQLARIDAYSRFTGGNARVAAILASLILEQQDPLVVSGDLTATLDKMTDYYRAQIDRIPDKPSKLFDALIRGGEPCSQTEMAIRVGAKQSDIAKAFSWLVDFGYIIGERLKGEKAIRYQVADRLFCQFYRMRHLRQQNSTKLTILTDLLADSILFKDKLRFADQYLKQGLEPEARTMAELGFNETRISLKKLPTTLQGTAQLIELGLFTDAKALFTRMLDNRYLSDHKVWVHGQIGRCIANLNGLDKAWQYIDNITVENKFNEQELSQCVQQLADVVLDFERHRNAGEAFVLAKQLLLDISNREALATESGVRAMWINMVDVGVSFALQRDILAEVVELLGGRLSELVNVLAAWLDDLDKTIEERAFYRKRLDPDLKNVVCCPRAEFVCQSKSTVWN